MSERKVKDLLSAGAQVTVISPEITAALKKLKVSKRITHVNRMFRDSDLDGAFLVVSATDDAKLNLRISSRKDLLVNIADHPDESSFIVPSHFRRGPLTVAISTSGASPAIARAIRLDMEDRYGREFGTYLTKLKGLRQRALKNITEPIIREKFLKKLAAPGIINKLIKGKQPELPALPELASKKPGRKK